MAHSFPSASRYIPGPRSGQPPPPQQTAPYTAPPMLNSLSFQANPLSSYATTASAIQGYTSLVGTDRIAPSSAMGGQAMVGAGQLSAGMQATATLPMSAMNTSGALPCSIGAAGSMPLSTTLCTSSIAPGLASSQGALPKASVFNYH
uniref:Uncharacterized protein n=1 Tax=Angiostrongylus cantonensis TaxID=6313 RepID=A0A0K0DEW2_ANGCA